MLQYIDHEKDICKKIISIFKSLKDINNIKYNRKDVLTFIMNHDKEREKFQKLNIKTMSVDELTKKKKYDEIRFLKSKDGDSLYIIVKIFDYRATSYQNFLSLIDQLYKIFVDVKYVDRKLLVNTNETYALFETKTSNDDITISMDNLIKNLKNKKYKVCKLIHI